MEIQDRDFVHTVNTEDLIYKLTRKVLSFDPETLITKTQEIVEVFDKENYRIDIQSAELTQKHWKKSELIERGQNAGFYVETKLLAGSDDSYFICTKK